MVQEHIKQQSWMFTLNVTHARYCDPAAESDSRVLFIYLFI